MSAKSKKPEFIEFSKYEKLQKINAILRSDIQDLKSNHQEEMNEYVTNQIEHHKVVKEKDAEIAAQKYQINVLETQYSIDSKQVQGLQDKITTLQKQFRDEMQIQETRLEAIAMMIQPSFESGINPETVAIAGHMLNVIQSQITAVEQLIEKLPS